MASIPKLLLDTLMDLEDQDLETFQWHLYQDVVKGSAHIPKSKIKDKGRLETVDVLVQTYGEMEAFTVSVEVLKAMNFRQLWEQLKERHNVGKVVSENF